MVQEWDNCGGSTNKALNITVGGTTLRGIVGWNQWGELPPSYSICSAPCSGVNWSMYQHISSPSLSGNATQFNIGGSIPYADILWSNPLIGDGSTEGLPDTNHTLLPSIHNLTVDTYVYVTNLAVTQDLEFDINMYIHEWSWNGVGN